jgi:transcriptional regulator with XRE-family HTH domain
MVRVHHIDKHIGGRLRALRAAKGLKADALCRSIRGLSMDCLERLENGDQRLSGEHMRQLCQALDVTPADFFRGLIIEPIADQLPALVADF